MSELWMWPSGDEVMDFPDPLGFEEEWRPWKGTLTEGPSRFAEIFCREHIQNSWDSIQSRMTEVVPAGEEWPHGYGVTFRFLDLVGEDAARITANLGLHEHVQRYAGMNEKDRRSARLDNSDAVKGRLDSVRVLVATEAFGEGMWGPWMTGGKANVVSRLKSALIQTQSAKSHETSGGSWGHGKKAIANVSSFRTIAVYSCSTEKAGDETPSGDPATRKFLGVSYWRRHDLQDRSFVGLGLLGRPDPVQGFQGFLPLQNGDADELVERLGLPGLTVRDPATPADTGVTYLMIDPVFGAEDLRWAIERNWWPLLEEHPESIRVVNEVGQELPIEPRSRPELVPFLAARELALDARPKRARGDVAQPLTSALVQGPVGNLGLTSDDTDGGWSYDSPDTNCSLVALVRNDMVVAYERFPRIGRRLPPYVRGTLVVDRDTNRAASEALKMAEPHLHNIWNTEVSNSVPGDAARLAKWTLNKVRDQVTVLRNALKGDAPKSEHQFSEFSELFAAGPTRVPGSGRPREPRGHRDFSIQFLETEPMETADPDFIRIRCEATISLSPAAAKKREEIVSHVHLGWGVLEESGVKKESSLSGSVEDLPSGFINGTAGGFVGPIKASPVRFTWTSSPFPDDWQVAPFPEVAPYLQPQDQAGEGGDE